MPPAFNPFGPGHQASPWHAPHASLVYPEFGLEPPRNWLGGNYGLVAGDVRPPTAEDEARLARGALGGGVTDAALLRNLGPPSYRLLGRHRSDVASLASFAHCVEAATFFMCVAFEEARVRDFDVRDDERRPSQSPNRSWFLEIADASFIRYRTLRRALLHDWDPPREVRPLIYAAFYNLCEITQAAAHQLKHLFARDTARAIEKLVGQLDLIANQLEAAIDLAADVENVLTDQTAVEDASRLKSVQAAILEQAGESLSLRAAAEQIGTSHQNLHKRIGTGSALGVMRGKEIVVPAIQFVGHEGAWQIVPHLRRVTAVFRNACAGAWSTLQFLVEHDPGIGAVPMEALKAGEVDAVVAAARAYLGLDES